MKIGSQDTNLGQTKMHSTGNYGGITPISRRKAGNGHYGSGYGQRYSQSLDQWRLLPARFGTFSHLNTKDKIIYILKTYAVPVIASMAFGLLVFLVTWRQQPIKFIGAWFEPAIAKSGDSVAVHKTILWRRSCRVESSEFFVRKNSRGDVLETVKFIDARVVPRPHNLGEITFSQTITIPPLPSFGKWHYRSIDRAVCWPWEEWFPIGPMVSDTSIEIMK